MNLSAAYPHTRRYPSILLYPRDAKLRMTAHQLIYRIKHKVGYSISKATPANRPRPTHLLPATAAAPWKCTAERGARKIRGRALSGYGLNFLKRFSREHTDRPRAFEPTTAFMGFFKSPEMEATPVASLRSGTCAVDLGE